MSRAKQMIVGFISCIVILLVIVSLEDRRQLLAYIENRYPQESFKIAYSPFNMLKSKIQVVEKKKGITFYLYRSKNNSSMVDTWVYESYRHSINLIIEEVTKEQRDRMDSFYFGTSFDPDSDELKPASMTEVPKINSLTDLSFELNEEDDLYMVTETIHQVTTSIEESENLEVSSINYNFTYGDMTNYYYTVYLTKELPDVKTLYETMRANLQEDSQIVILELN